MASNALQGSEALATMHAGGVLHRDVKPDNILLLTEGGDLMLNDYDVSCTMTDSLSRKDFLVGSPAYRSPRLEEGQFRQYDVHDDWLSLGLTFAYLVKLYDPEKAHTPESKRGVLEALLRLGLPVKFDLQLRKALER